MAENVGRVEIIATIDGKDLDAQVKALGQRAGAMLSKSLSKDFEKGMDKVTLDMRKGLVKVQAEVDRTTRSVDRLGHSWKQLPHGFRQFTFFTGLFAALGEEIAVLGSAAGAGLGVLSSAFVSLGIGVGTTIAVFQDLNGEISELPPEIQDAATAFQSLGRSFTTLRKKIQVAALDKAADSFTSLEATVTELGPAFEEVGESVGRLIDDLARGIAPGTRNFKNLNNIIKTAGPIFERLAKNVGIFSEGLLEAFASSEMNRAVNQFIDWLDEIANGFLNFTRSDALGVWLRHAEKVFGALGGLLAATGTALNDLVDEAAVKRLVAFLDNLTAFMPHAENLLSIIGELDIFGLIAQALADFGDALEPLAGPMEELAGALSNIVSIAIDEWADRLGDVATALTPFVQGIADFLEEADEEDIRAVADALFVLGSAVAVLAIGGKLLAAAKGIGALAKSLGTLKATAKGGLGGILAGLFTGLFTASDADTLEGAFADVIGAALTGALTGLFVGGPIGAVLGGLIAAAFASDNTAINEWEDGINESINQFFADLWVNIGNWWNEGWANFGSSFDTSVFSIIQTAFNDFFFGVSASVSTWFSSLIVSFGVWLQGLWTTVSTWFGSLLLTVVTWLGQIWAGISAWFTGVITGWNAFWLGLSVIVITVWNTIMGFVITILTQIGSFINTKVGEITRNWNSWWGGVASGWSNFWSSIENVVSDSISNIESWIDGLLGWIGDAIGALGKLFGLAADAPSTASSGGGGMASGGIVYSGARRLIGEDGPEAVVPLNRSLSQVDPSVRALSAFAQGLSGGGSPAGKIVNVHPGAIVVQTVAAPYQVANMVLDRLVASAAV